MGIWNRQNQIFWVDVSTTTVDPHMYYRTGVSRQVLDHYEVAPYLTFSASSTNSQKMFYEPFDSNNTSATLDRGQYEFELTRLTVEDNEDDVYNKSDLYVRFVEEVNTTPINYGGLALLGMNLKASQQISGTRPEFSVKCTRQPLFINNEYRDCTNPAWVCYDILTNTQYGGGVSPNNINFTEFKNWADFCDSRSEYTTSTITHSAGYSIYNGKLKIANTNDTQLNINSLNYNLSSLSLASGSILLSNIISIENIRDNLGNYYLIGFNKTLSVGTTGTFSLTCATSTYNATPKLSFNGVIDTSTDIWSAVQDAASVGRGQIILQGNKYSVIYDAPKVVTGLYNASNSKNVSVHYIGSTDIASEIELQYSDSSINYEMNQVSIQDVDANSGERAKKTTVQVKGITSQAEALTHGRYLLAASKAIRRTATFEADIESITQTVGDLVALQTDVTSYGLGGLIQKVLGSTLTLEEPVDLVQGTSYVLKVKNNLTDVITDYNFVATNTESTFDVTIVGHGILVNDRYTFGELQQDSFLGTITNISRDGELSRDITIVEYNESILDFNYDNDILQRTVPTYTARNTLSNFQVKDTLVKQKTGQVYPVLQFSWEALTGTSNYTIYRYSNGEKKVLGAVIYGNTFDAVFMEPVTGAYTFYIEDNNTKGTAISTTITITAFDKIPDKVTGLTSNSSNGELILSWNPNTELDFKEYIVEINSVQYSSTLPKNSIVGLAVGTYVANVWVVDTAGNKSEVLTQEVFVTEPPLLTMIEDSYLLEKAFRDGLMTIYVGDNASITAPINYDIWKNTLGSLTVAEFTYASIQLEGVSFDGLQGTTFRYYKDGQWYVCSKAQLLVIQRMLGYVTVKALNDGAVRVFNKQPYPPYNLGDLWIDGTTVRSCIVEKEN